MFFLRTYRHRLFAYTFVLVIFLAGSQLYSFSQARQAVLQEAERSLQQTAQLFEANLTAERRELEQFVTILRDDKRLQEYVFVVVNFDSGREVLQSLYKKNFGWLPADRAFIVGNDASIILGEKNDRISAEVLPIETSNAAFSYYTQGKHGIELIAAAPIIYKEKKLGWVALSRELNGRWLEQKKKEGVGQLIIEKGGVIRQSTLAGFAGGGFGPEQDRISFNGETYRLFPVHFPNSTPEAAKLWFGASVTEMTKGLNRHRNNTLIQVVVGFVFVLLLAWLSSRNFDRPLAQLAAFTREISEGRYPVVQKSEVITELDILANQFADMVHALREKDAQVTKVHQKLEYTAVTDALTGLFNRRAFESALNRAVEGARSENTTHALCYLDLDQFKIVNDTCGHEAGDELLRQLTGILKSRMRDDDTLARLGGDEFGLIIFNIDKADALKVADDLLAMVKAFKYFWNDKLFDVGVSIGLVTIDSNTKSFADVLRRADIACYTAKNEGRNRVHFYQPSDKDASRLADEVNWLHTLRDALHENRFQIWYQPIAKTAGKSDIEHGEILLRLVDSNGKMCAPGAFIPAAERHNFMPQIDRWVFSATLRYVKSRLKVTDRFLCAINLSALSLNDEELLQYFHDTLRRDSIPGSVLCFEITETAAIHNLANAINFVTKLKQLGCQFALDDFGAGLSTFRYLKHLPVDYIKIDGGFVSNMTTNVIDKGMVRAINQIAHLMGKKTIAEFVENEQVLKELEAIGVDYVQGYWIGKPSPLDAFSSVDVAGKPEQAVS